MHCAICDTDDDIISIFPNDLCPRCEAIIQETLEDFDDPDEDLESS